MRQTLLRSLCVFGAFLSSTVHAAADVSELLETIRGKRNVPALAAAVVQDGEIVTAGAVGLRRLGGTNKATVDDLWHFGSCTKSMTASVATILVERGDLRWEQTIGDALAKRCPRTDEAWKHVTLDQLFRHRAGAPTKAPRELWAQAWQQQGTPSEQRWAFVSGMLAAPPENPPGTTFAYSNQGYSIAGHHLSLAQFAKLHTPLPGHEYAMWWFVTQRPWGGGTVLMHNGSNLMNFAVMWVAPERKFAVGAATNSAGPAAERACDDACAQLIDKFLEKR